MKLALSLAALAASAAVTALALPTDAAAAGPQIQIPDFSHLRRQATDSVDITLDGFLLRIAKKFAKAEAENSDEDAEALRLLNDIKSVRVRTFEFAADGVYSKADIDSVRRQLEGPGWSALVQAHKREPQSDVDVFLNAANGKILGLAVIASEPRSFTIVNIVGSIDIDKLAKIEGQFGIPKISQNEPERATPDE